MLRQILAQSFPGATAARIICSDARLAVESRSDRISFGLSALGIALFQRGSLPMTATLVSFSTRMQDFPAAVAFCE
jgi:hypothetical protein